VIVLGGAQTISSGTWIAGVPEMVRSVLHGGAAGYSLLMVGYAAGSITVGAIFARYPIQRKARASVLIWILYLPAFGLFAVGHSLSVALAGSFLSGFSGTGESILLTSAAQERIADHMLGRVMGLIALVHRGGHAMGLMLISPLFAVFSPTLMFAAASIAIPLVALAGFLSVVLIESRYPAIAAAAGEVAPK
jgi:hypothetical protein